MKTLQINKFNLKVGSKINCYYGNGQFNTYAEVSRITESSCFLEKHGLQRESWNTVNTKIETGLYKII